MVKVRESGNKYAKFLSLGSEVLLKLAWTCDILGKVQYIFRIRLRLCGSQRIAVVTHPITFLTLHQSPNAKKQLTIMAKLFLVTSPRFQY